MNIFTNPQFSLCVNYDSDNCCGFASWKLKEGDMFVQAKKENNHIIFVIKGEMMINCDEFANIRVKSGQMIFLPNKSDCSYKSLSALHLIVFTFERFTNLCDKYMFQKLAEKQMDIRYTLKPLTMHELLISFIQLLTEYLQVGINCKHMHEEKQTELLILLRACYKKEELLFFFYPLITSDMDFRQLVLETYTLARNVQELARLTGYNISDFRNKFLADFGEPAYQWMQKRKGISIKFRLMMEDVDLATLSNEFGFSSPAHFNKFCKKQFGTTPALLKRQLKQQDDFLLPQQPREEI